MALNGGSTISTFWTPVAACTARSLLGLRGGRRAGLLRGLVDLLCRLLHLLRARRRVRADVSRTRSRMRCAAWGTSATIAIA